MTITNCVKEENTFKITCDNDAVFTFNYYTGEVCSPTGRRVENYKLMSYPWSYKIDEIMECVRQLNNIPLRSEENINKYKQTWNNSVNSDKRIKELEIFFEKLLSHQIYASFHTLYKNDVTIWSFLRYTDLQILYNICKKLEKQIKEEDIDEWRFITATYLIDHLGFSDFIYDTILELEYYIGAAFFENIFKICYSLERNKAREKVFTIIKILSDLCNSLLDMDLEFSYNSEAVKELVKNYNPNIDVLIQYRDICHKFKVDSKETSGYIKYSIE